MEPEPSQREPEEWDKYFDEIIEHCNAVADWFIARHRGEVPKDGESLHGGRGE